MKSKTKVIVGLAAMLAGTVGVAGVSTFAWFTTQNTAKVTFNDAVVRGDSTNISISYATTQPGNAKVVNDATHVVTDTKGSLVQIKDQAVQVVDLSGNGKTFYRPSNYKADGYTSSGVTTYATNVATQANTSTATYFLTFNITITNKSDLLTDVFFDSTSGIVGVDAEGATARNAANIPAAKAARVAVWQLGSSESEPSTSSTLRTIYHPNTDETTFKYLAATNAATTEVGTDTKVDAFGLTGKNISEFTADVTTPGTSIFDKAFTKTLSAPGTSAGGSDAAVAPTPTGYNQGTYVCSLPATFNASKTINISMWIEGTSSYGTIECVSAHLGLTLGLTGVQRTIS